MDTGSRLSRTRSYLARKTSKRGEIKKERVFVWLVCMYAGGQPQTFLVNSNYLKDNLIRKTWKYHICMFSAHARYANAAGS